MNNHRKCRGRILVISDGIFPTQQSTKSTFWTKNSQIRALPKQYTLQLTGLSSVGMGGVRRERERESRVSSLVDPSENGGGRVSGGGGHRREIEGRNWVALGMKLESEKVKNARNVMGWER